MITENTRVKTMVEKDGFPSGSIGVVVSIYGSGSGCEVEIWDDDGYPVDVVTFSMNELQPLPAE